LSSAADKKAVLRRALAITSLACCALLLVSFALFARDQVAGASAHQQSELASGAAVAPSPPSTNQVHAQPRRFIDDAAGRLSSPFSTIAHSSNPWVDHGLPTLFGLIVYGIGLRFVARFSAGRA
jgi:hypothetical protein